MSFVIRIIVSLLLLCLSVPLVAQEKPAAFLIEKIEVRGVRFASETVIERETLLVEGKSYSEGELKDAMNRINRLPFVLESSFALEKGSERGAYMLVISVTETKPLFVDAQSNFSRHEGSSFGTEGRETIQSGIRYFLGSSSLVHAATDFHDNYEVGITQYNLFGRAGYASLRVRWTENEIDQEFQDPFNGFTYRLTAKSDPVVELRAGVPLFGNHSIDARVERQSYESTQSTPDYSQRQSSTTDHAMVSWLYDTTDDAVLPTNGTLWRTGADYFDSQQEVEVAGEPPYPITEGTFRVEQYFSIVDRYFAITRHQSLMGGVGVGHSIYRAKAPHFPDSSTDSTGGFVAGGFSSTLWSDALTRKLGDLRFETRASYAFGPDSYGYRSARAAIVQRNVWGTLRLSFDYSDSDVDSGE